MKIKRVVEASFQSLSKGNGGSGKPTARESPVYHFLEEAMPESSLAEGSLHTLARHLMAQLLPLLEPRAVKMASVIGARSSSLHAQTVRRHADAMLLMQYLVFAAVFCFEYM
jgi:hypothetical protein